MTAPAKSDTHVLYRFYDADDVLLYVGITNNPPRRFKQHGKSKDWWALVSHVRMETFGTREDLQDAERAAIKSENPIHNLVHAVNPILAEFGPECPGCGLSDGYPLGEKYYRGSGNVGCGGCGIVINIRGTFDADALVAALQDPTYDSEVVALELMRRLRAYDAHRALIEDADYQREESAAQHLSGWVNR